ncbi:phenylalanine--tRNA ligase subunit beta [Brevibacillus dissolubilis]|uniref:phenylalanine--tRNA ligase subunit beta n=1 Tax=Brevibacillus dissolubilis TaxID=1844116 RepID=UPI001116D7E4|nr:phenylalanine--tRNA ligase subunit beta [Brevibacillus dissolubilis]
MRVSYNWLKEYVDLTDITPQELAERMTRSGIEVDAIESRNTGVSNVVVGYVKEREQHPDADRLSVCKVDVGNGEDLQIVCGAKNVAAGQKVPIAMIGAVLPGDFKIKKSKLRGVESQGMICSAKELGLNDKLLAKDQQEGIMVLPEDAEIGMDAVSYLGMDDYVLELGLTPNRADAMSMIGVAYEVAAILGREVIFPEMNVVENGEANPVRVTIEAKDHCYQYAGRHFTNVKIGSSPQWLKNRLMAANVRPINNVVDVTNYVMLELGLPLHAFDASQVVDKEIIVRLAQEGEKITTLDDQERTLDDQTLLITDKTKGVAIAGIMGGANSEVTDETTEIILEAAYFTQQTVRRSARKTGIRSEAGTRWEKGVDQARVKLACDRAALLIQQLSGATVSVGVADDTVQVKQPLAIDITLEKINEHLGTSIDAATVTAIYTRLQFQVEEKGAGAWTITVPTRRGDITLVEDLIEEVARLYGYDNIPITLPFGETTPGRLQPEQLLRRIVRHHLIGLGLNETVSYALLHPERMENFDSMIDANLKRISLIMPLSEEHSVLRTNLIASLVETATYNKNRQNHDLGFFELGNVFLTEEDQLTKLPEQRLYLGGLIAGQWVPQNWTGAKQPADFFLTKGVVESVLDRIGLKATELTYQPTQTRKGMHPGRTADVLVGGNVVGFIGQIHPQQEKAYDLDETYVFQFDLSKLFSHAKDFNDYKPLPKFPAITRDFALVVDRSLPVAALEEIIRRESGDLLESVTLFDVYTGERIDAAKKSVAFSMVYRHPEHTLQDEEVQAVTTRVVEALKEAGAELRS